MRSKRTFSVRAASLGGSLALVGASLAGTVGLVAAAGVSSTPAGADTPSFTATCTGLPSVGTATFSGRWPGSLPSSVSPGQSVSLSGLKFKTALSGSTLQLAKGLTLSGNFTLGLTATGGTPASQTAGFVIPDGTPIPAQSATFFLIPLNLPAPPGAITAGSSGTLTVKTGTSGSITIAVNGGVGWHFPVHLPGEQIATTTIKQPAGSISAVLPSSAPLSGGSTVTIHCAFLNNPTGVTFGGVAATSFVGLTANSVSAVVPAAWPALSPWWSPPAQGRRPRVR